MPVYGKEYQDAEDKLKLPDYRNLGVAHGVYDVHNAKTHLEVDDLARQLDGRKYHVRSVAYDDADNDLVYHVNAVCHGVRREDYGMVKYGVNYKRHKKRQPYLIYDRNIGALKYRGGHKN